VNKRRSHRFPIERLNQKKLNDAEGNQKWRVEVSNRFAALEDSDAEVEINSVWEMIKEYQNFSQREFRLFLI
jgi:hypothetical protein